MSVKSCNITKMLSSHRLIPEWKDLKLLINSILEDTKDVENPTTNALVVLSDWPETLYQEPHHTQNKPFICFYSINDNYFVSLNWVEPLSKQMQAMLWIQKKDPEMEGMIEKMKFHIMDPMPPIQAMVHTGSYHMLIAYCGDMRLWLFGDHHQAFTSLGTVPCRFSISCLCYDSKTEILLSGTLGAVVTWFILPSGRGLQMAQTVPMPDHETVQGFSLNGPQGSLLAFCENNVRVFTHQDQGQLKEVKKFTPTASGSFITCSFTCVSQGYFYTGNRDGEIHAWSLDQGNFLHSFQAHSSSVICVHSRPEIHTLLTAGSEGAVREWNLAFGNLLRQLDVEDLQQLQFIDNTTFFCQTTHTFSLHNLPYFYSLFNVCGSALQQVQRVCCGHNWTRILCATKDGLLRFLSPVTGNLLVITWPLLVMDKVVAWAYDSDREELFVATDSSEVLVFDATRSPCTAKYLVCISVNPGDRIRCLAYGHSHVGRGLPGLMFCGHESGTVRILSHYRCARIEKTVHSGAVLALSTLEGPQENSLLCSYGMDNTVQLTKAVLQKNKVILQHVIKILCDCLLKHVILLPGSVGAITENHCWCLWHYQDFLTSSESKQSSMFKETKRLHHCPITSFDVCLSLKLFVTGGIDGSVRIWDFHGRLITELDSALHFGPLCFANNRGDLLLTFNQSLYLVSCLTLFPPAQLIHLATLNNADEIQEAPKPFLPSFFFSFETVFVPKFVYLGQGLQELQGLEALVNKRVIAFDNTVPHVVEEEKHMSSVFKKGPKLHFLADTDIDFSTLDREHNRPPHLVPAQLRLAYWDGLNRYHILQYFFGKGKQWPFAPDGYIPNSVVRARLWPEGTPIFLLCDLYPHYRDKGWDGTELFRHQALSSMTLVKEKISKGKQDTSKKWKQTLFDVLASMTNLNWIGRKLDESLINTLIESILNFTIYCSIEQYETYISVLAKIFATCQVPSSLYSETACRFLEDTAHSNAKIRELAWEALERLGLMGPLFAVPLAEGLMDNDENVRVKALNLMIRVTGIQTKTMLVNLLKKRGLFQDMQREFIGKASLDQLLGIQAKDIQSLLRQVEKQLNENLTLSRRDQQFTFPSDISKAVETETFAKRALVSLLEPKKISKPKEKMKHSQAKSRLLIKKDLRVPREQKQTKFVKLSSLLVPSKDKGEQKEAMRLEKTDTQDVALEPELPLRTFSPVKSQEDAESKGITLEETDVIQAAEATELAKAIDQHGMKDYEKVIPKLERREHMKGLWKRAMEKSQEKDVKLKEKKDLEDISKTTAEEPKEEVTKITEQENDTEGKLEMRRHGLAGTPGRTGRSDTRCWRDDICSLAVSRIASSHPGMARDLGQELVDLAQVMLAPRYPSWSIFQGICPFLKGSSDLYQEVAEQQFIITEKGVQEVKKEGIVRLRKKRGKKVLKEGKAFSQVKKKKIAFLQDHLVLEKKKFKKEVRQLARQEGKTAEEERKLSKPEKKLTWEKEKLIKDKNVTHQQEKIAWEEKTLASSQKKLTRGEQELVLREKKWTGRDRKVLGERKGVIWKEGKAIPGRRKWDLEETWLAQKEGIWAQEEGLPIWEEMKLSQEEEKADEREEETGEGGEDLAWDEEEPILDVEKQVEEKKKKPYKEKKHIPGMEKHVEDKAWKRGKLAQKEKHLSRKEEGLSGEEGKWAFKKGSLAEQEIKLTPEKKKWSVKEKKEVHKKKQIQEKKEQVEKQEKEDQKERQAKKDEKEAKDEQLAWKRKKLGLETENFGEMKVLSQEDKQTEKKVKEAWEKERRAQKEERATKKQRQQVWGRNKVDLREEGQGGEMEKWSQKDKKQAWGKRMQDQKEERLAGKVEKEEDKKRAGGERTRDQKEEGLAGKVEKEEDKKRAWGERMRGQKEERLAGKVEKEEDKKRAWGERTRGQKEQRLAGKVEKEEDKKQAWGERMQGQKEERLAGKVEKKEDKKQAWGERTQDQKEERLAGKVEKEEDKKRAWGERMRDQKEERLAGKVEKEEVKKRAWGERMRDQKEERLVGKVEKEEDKKRAWGERTRDQKEERLVGKVEKEEDKKRAWGERTRDQKEERLVGKVEKEEDKKRAWGERTRDQKEERLVGKVEKEEDKKRAWGERTRDQKEERLVGKVEKEEDKKRAWGERTRDQKEERLVGKVEKEEDKKRAWGERTRDQKEERLAGKVEKKEDKKWAWGERMRDQKEKRLAGKVEKEEDKKRAWGERTRDQKEERLAGKVEKEEDKKRAWGERTRDQKEERLAGKVEKEEDKKWAWGERTWDQKEERLAGKVEKEAEGKKQQATEKMKLVPEVEEKRKEIGKVSPKGEQQLMKKEKEAKKEEKLFRRDKKVTEENKQRTYEKGQLALQGETQAQKERMWRQKKAKDSEHKEHWAWGKEKLFLDEEEQAGEMEEKSQEKAIMKKEGKLSQEERQLVYDRTKETDVAKGKKKRTQRERIQAMGKLVMKRRVSSEEKEALSRGNYLRMRERQLWRILAKTVREIIRVPLEEIKIPEEERSSITGRSEIDGKRWEILKEQEKITKEKEVDQKERKVEGDRLATEERTLTDDEGFEEDQWLLEKVQETILLDQIQVESVLNEIQEQNLLGGEQLKELQKRIENKSEKIQVKWLLENIRDILFEGLSESLTEQETEEGPTKEGKEEESLSEEERTEKIEREEERQEEEAALTKEKEEASILKGAVLSEEERVLKTELSKEGVTSKLVKEGKILAEEREGTARREAPFKKERFLDGKRHPTFMDKLIWPTVPKSPFKIPLPVALEKKEGMPLKILGDRLDLEGQESQLGRASPRGRKEDRLLEKARGIFLQETGLETQIPQGLHRPGPCLPGSIIKPQKPEHRLKGGRWKWFVKYRDSSAGKSEGQAPAPAPVPAPSLTSLPAKTETSFSDEDWVNNALIRLKAGEQLSRDSFHRLNQLLRDFTSKGYLKWMHLYNLKTIAKHFRPNLEASHTDIPQSYKDVLSPLHLKVIPPIRRIEKESWREPLPSPEPVLPSATRTQTPQAVNWHLLAESYRKKQAQQLSTAVKEIKHICPIIKDEKPLALIFQKDFQALRGRGESPKFHKAKRKPLPIPAPVLPSTTKEIQVPMAINWHHLGEPYRSARVQQLISALREMEMRHFYPAQRDIFPGARASVEKQTLALMFQKDLRAFKGKGKLPKLPQLEKVKTNSKRQEDVPLWETFVALYHVLRMLQERYAEDSATWMEQFYQVMDLYQLKSPGIQRLLLELLQRRELQPQETIYKKALKTKEPVLGERLFCGLFCGRSHTPAGPLKFQDVIPLPGQNRVHTLQNVGIARYGFLELAWKSLPQVNPSLIERLPNIPTPTL